MAVIIYIHVVYYIVIIKDTKNAKNNTAPKRSQEFNLSYIKRKTYKLYLYPRNTTE